MSYGVLYYRFIMLFTQIIHKKWINTKNKHFFTFWTFIRCIHIKFSYVFLRINSFCCCCSVAKSCLTLCDCGLQHVRLPCPSLSPRVCSNSHSLSRSCHPTISSSGIPFFSCLQSFPTSGSFPMSQLFTSGGQSIRVSASASVLPNIQGWFPLGLTGLIYCCPRYSQKSSPAPQFKNINSSALSLLYGPALTSICDYRKNYRFDYLDLCQQSDVFAF